MSSNDNRYGGGGFCSLVVENVTSVQSVNPKHSDS